MKALVTGATGFLGGGLVSRLLSDGWEVDILIRDKDEARADELIALGVGRAIVANDASSAHAAVTEVAPDAIAHLATWYLKTHTPADIAGLVHSNVEFGTGVLDAASLLDARVVLTSSFFQFLGGRREPASLYAATKQALAEIASYYADKAQLDVRETIMYDTYGPGDARDKLVPLLARAAATGEPARLGSPHQAINLTYLDDVAAGLAALMTAEEAPTLTSIRQATPTSVGEVASTLAELAGHPLDISFREDAPTSDLPFTAGDWPTPPGWAPQVPLVEGLRRTVEAVRASLPTT
ncbi:MAG: NAD(P)-dependent oxidoreductase [Cellulomonadaceae bacterium]|jgi:nucleoside-diphosphate-sugar epimerase|nr:NAD(P)-dependent oxidoreductase [Cellulomonadaceae bacterium]